MTCIGPGDCAVCQESIPDPNTPCLAPGSLDADNLEIAMSALENLQAGGKTIGVISHVPAMQERIPAQINVNRETGGCSRVQILL